MFLNKQNLLNLIAENKLDEAIYNLLEHLKEADSEQFTNSVIIQKNRLKRHRRKSINGTDRNEELDKTYNQIVNSILDIINELDSMSNDNSSLKDVGKSYSILTITDKKLDTTWSTLIRKEIQKILPKANCRFVVDGIEELSIPISNIILNSECNFFIIIAFGDVCNKIIQQINSELKLALPAIEKKLIFDNVAPLLSKTLRLVLVTPKKINTFDSLLLDKYKSLGLKPPNISTLSENFDPYSPPQSTILKAIIENCRIQNYQIIAIINQTIKRAYELSCAGKISKLYSWSDSNSTTTKYSQQKVHDTLEGIILSPSSRLRRIVLTGQAGVGKSTLLFTLASRIGWQFNKLNDVLPFFFLLQKESLSEKEMKEIDNSENTKKGLRLFQILVNRWCQWFNNELINDDNIIDFDWIWKRITSAPTVLLFDGIDEFAANNPKIETSLIREMLVSLEKFCDGANRFIVSTVRSSFPRHYLLASTRKDVYEVGTLPINAALKHWPDISLLLDDIPQDMLNFLMTPLILRWIGPRAKLLSSKNFGNETQVYHEALIAIIEESRLNHHYHEQLKDRTTTEQWLDALTTVGWILYSGFHGQIHVNKLMEEARKTRDRWETHGIEKGSSTVYPFISGIQLLEDETTCKMLLKRTIFSPVGYMITRLIHREWQEFLAARYLATIVRLGNIFELGFIGYNQNMFRLANFILEDSNTIIRKEFMEELLASSNTNTLISANFAGLLGNGFLKIDRPAIKMLLSVEVLEKMENISRLIVLSLAYRCLKNLSSDTSSTDLRIGLIELFETLNSDKRKSVNFDTVTYSLIWCYHKAFAVRFGCPPPKKKWVDLSKNKKHDKCALSIMSSEKDGERFLTMKDKSVQAAFLKVQGVIKFDKFRPISVVHYLYCIVIAAVNGVAITDSYKKLPLILHPDSDNSKIIAKYDTVPELKSILDYCRQRYITSFPNSFTE